MKSITHTPRITSLNTYYFEIYNVLDSRVDLKSITLYTNITF